MRSLEEVEDPRDSEGLDDPVEENPPHRRWLVLAGVCHTWRTVLLSSPLLWSRIEASIFRRPDILEKFISASRKAPLDVCITDVSPLHFVHETDILGKSLERILKEGVRLKSLHLIFRLPIFQYFFLAFHFKFSFTHLQSLEILLDQSEVKGTYVPEPSCGFAAFMEADFRSLRHVALTNVHTEWQLLSKLPSTVTDLSITNELQPLLAGPMSDVLDVLKKLVDLKRLTLYDCLPRMAGGSTERVYLSKLEKLTIAGEITRVMPLFDCLEHPLATIVCVGLEVDPGQDISSASLSVFSRMCRMYEGRPDQMEASICVARAYVSISLFADTVPESQLFFKPTENSDDTQSISSLDLLRGALEAAALTLFLSVTSLWLTLLDHHTHDAPRLLPLIFQILNRVESITVEGQVTLLTEALRPQQDMPVSLPRLSHLGLADTRIVEDTEDQPFRILSADVLYSCLEERKDHGCGIQLLELYDDCTVHVSAADEFRGRLLTVVKDIEGWEK
ncbi:hypothetical protein QCA50_020035 [Cerrena zonata]|uniref:F-box domain-containing protein n=1 Tax=Cerrena zonata TaxID=2478898 RepID=A0AAW0F9U3_9APHY